MTSKQCRNTSGLLNYFIFCIKICTHGIYYSKNITNLDPGTKKNPGKFKGKFKTVFKITPYRRISMNGVLELWWYISSITIWVLLAEPAKMQHFYFQRPFTTSKFFFTESEIKISISRIKYQVDCIHLVAFDRFIILFGYSFFHPLPMAVSRYMSFKAAHNVMHNMLTVHPSWFARLHEICVQT